MTRMKERKYAMQKMKHSLKRGIAFGLSAVMTFSLMGVIPGGSETAEAAERSQSAIANNSLSVEIGDLGQISVMNILNNRKNSQGNDVNFVLPNNTSNQNNAAHQWMGEMIFSYRTSEDGTFPEGREGFVEVDTNKTLAAGGSTTYSNATENLEKNPYIKKNVINDKKVEIDFIGQEAGSETARTMKGFDVKSEYDMDTEDGSLLWTITLKNKSEDFIEFGDVGLPMPWNNKYTSQSSVYNERVTAHTFAGADSGYAYAIRCSGEGNYILFTPVPESGARIEYVDNWVGNNNGVRGERAASTFANWTGDSGGWQPGLSVYYIHSKDIQKTGRGYYTDASSLVLKPGESESYQFKFSAVRAGDNTPQESADSANNASDSVEERETNMRSLLYDAGMIDAIAVPGFQTALNMQTKLDLHYDDEKIKVDSVDIQCVHENDPFDEKHIPQQTSGLVSNSRAGECAANDSATFVEKKTVDGENHHIYDVKFGCIGNNSVRVNYKLKVGDEWVDKFTQYEFNALAKLDEVVESHADFMVNKTQDNNPDSPTYGNYQDWYISQETVDPNAQNHWGDDWSHDNINFMTMKNYLNPVASEVESIEKYLIDYMWNNYMKYTQSTYTVANYLGASGIYGTSASPYTRTFSEVMEATGFFNMYRIQKAYPDLIEYRETPEWYLEKAYGIYSNRVGTGAIGFYGEQQIPDMIDALREEGMTKEADNLQDRFARRKGTNMATAAYPYGSEFTYDNTGEEGAYAAAKALREYYPDDANVGRALTNMNKAEWKTRAMRGIQPTWYHYANPVFLGGEHWWNFQYTASLAGSIMDDWLRYQDNGWDADSSAWAQRVNYAAKLSNFNAVNMGQISDKSIGSVSWRYTQYKGGHGAMNVNDGGTRIMNNGWNDFSGESEEGLYGSLLRISSDVVTDPIFGLTGYGSTVSKSGTSYTVTPADGVGKRINIIDDKLYAELEQDSCTQAVINSEGPSFDLALKCLSKEEHLSRIKLSGAGLTDGYYSIKLDGKDAGQCFVKNHEGIANVMIPEGKETASVSIAFKGEGENEAPVVKAKVAATDKLQALTPFRLESIAYDDGAPNGTLSYKWETLSAPEGGEITFDSDKKPYTEANCSRVGRYKVRLSVSDGELTGISTLDLTIKAADGKTAPVISEASAVQDGVNTSVAQLTGKAEADQTYHNELKYEWKIIGQPEGGNAIIANADKADARMKAYKPGEYLLSFTVTDEKATPYDETMSSQKYVSVNMSGRVDGVERVGTVLTAVGTAPELPEEMEVICQDSTLKKSAIEWAEIDAESYAEAGQFEAGGEVEGAGKVAATVVVMSGKAQNLAMQATPTAIINTPQDLGGVAGLNDGFEPTRSSDTSHGVWHNWLGDQGGKAWVRYTWEEPVTIYQTDAYYFRDGGGNFQPKDIKYEYLDSDGKTWRDMPNVKGCGNALNQYNTTTFEPVSTTSLRMTMTPVTLGCGVIEWKVFGFGGDDENETVDRTKLNSIISQAKALNTSLFAEGAKEILDAGISEAQSVADNAAATQAEIDLAIIKLGRIMATLPTADNNFAYSASASTSFVSGWESLASVNDGRLPGNSTNPGAPRYGSWGNRSSYETITYTWNSKVSLNSADIYYWHDGDNENVGGIRFPKDYYYEYLADDGTWKQVENPSGYAKELHKYNNTTFTPVETTSIRVHMNKQQSDSNGVGVLEWKVYGGAVAGDNTALNTLVQETENFVKDGSKDYSISSWNALLDTLKAAKKILGDNTAGPEEIKAVLDDLKAAKDGLVAGKGIRNLASKAQSEASGNASDLAALNDGKEPADSTDNANGVWHNKESQDAGGTVRAAGDGWVSYSWNDPRILSSTEAYYYSNETESIKMPQSVKFEYKTSEGGWAEVPNAEGKGCESDKYNTTTLGNIQTTGLRMTMEPQTAEGSAANYVGVIEWKVNGISVAELDKTKLTAAIAEAEKITNLEQYTADSRARFEEAFNAAKEMAKDGGAVSQSEIDRQARVLKAAISALMPAAGDQKVVLQKLITLAEEEAASDLYTQETKDALAAAINTAKQIAAKEDATQEEISGQLAALSEAVNELEKKPVKTVNKVELEAAIADAGRIVKEDYTAESLAELENVLNQVKEVLASADASQEQVDESTDRLYKAIDQLVKAPEEVVNKNALSAAIDRTKELKETDYTAASWEVMRTALTTANQVMRDETATQREVNEATAALRDALAALVRVDKAGLRDAINRANERNEADYTKESWAAMQTALAKAKEVEANANAVQEEVDDATYELSEALRNLKAVVNKNALSAAIDRTKDLKETDHTATSWKALQEALKTANEAMNSETITQEEVNAATVALREALEALVRVDKSGLHAAIDRANERKEEDYPDKPDEWAAMQEALAKAVEVAENADAVQKEVDDATYELSEALRALDPEGTVNKNALNAAIDRTKDLKESDHTATSWKALQEALKTAVEVAESETVTQEEVNAATAALRDALAALVRVDKAGLQDAINRANERTEADYTKESWAAMQTALAKAVEVAENADAVQKEVDDATYELSEALRNLKEVVNKNALKAAIDRTKDLEESDHTAASWAAMQEALKTANQALESETVTQEEVNAATAALRDALAALVRVDKAGLRDAINRANERNEADYTKESWAAMQTALAKAKEVEGNADAVQKEVDDATFELSEALRNLVETDPGRTELNAALSAAKALRKDDYTPEAWAVFQKALADAEAVFNNPKATKEQTAAAAASLKKAIEEVKKNPAKKNPQPVVVKVKKISISGLSKKIAAGKKVKLTAKISPSNASNKGVTWKSSNKKVATVNSKGVVTMKKKSGGKSVTITATAKDGSKVKATYKIKSMKGKVTKVTISGKKSVKAGKNLKLTGKVKATKSANKKLKWTSSNKKYATVTSSGKVKALKAGKGKRVKITAMATDGSGKKKTVVIKITK